MKMNSSNYDEEASKERKPMTESKGRKTNERKPKEESIGIIIVIIRVSLVGGAQDRAQNRAWEARNIEKPHVFVGKASV